MKIFNLPDLGEGLAEAEIREWYVKVGDKVKVDQPLVSMETAKAVVDVPSPYTGEINALHGAVNDIIKTGAPLVTFQTEDGKVQAPAKNSVVGALEEGKGPWEESTMIIGSAQKKQTQTIKAMPAARLIAQEMQIDLSKVKATGPNGLITVSDVKAAVGAKEGYALPADAESLHGVRRQMALTMSKAHQEVVPATVIDDADITHLPPKTDLTALLLRAIAAGIKAEPALNAWFDGKNLTRKLFSEVHVGIAIDSGDGLFVPVIRAVENAGTLELRQQIDALKLAVKERKITGKAMQGATITLSNVGTIAGRYATPIIVPPTVAILATGRRKEVPIVKNGQVTIGTVLPLSLTFDHRAVTGGEATRFLAAVIAHLQQ